MSMELKIPQIYKEINSNNYLSNCYRHLIRYKGIHFIFILIEILLNIFQEIEVFINDYKLDNALNNKPDINLVTYITLKFCKIKNIIKLIIIIAFIVIFDLLYTILKLKSIQIKHICFSILVNILEIIIFRTVTIIFLNLFFTLEKELLIIGLIFLIPHLLLTINNFLYNHLYYFVPQFIDYPYDEFSSLYDIILFIIKFFLSIAGTTNNSELGKFCFIIMFVLQILFSLYFIYILTNHSYYFMKNSFLNITKVSLFFTNTITLIIIFLFGKDEIITTLFLIISICVLLTIMSYMYSIYNPFSHIIIKRETPLENIFFYLYILSEKNDFNFLFENKINKHFEKCGICDLCNKYIKYKNRFKQKNILIEEEKENLINEENQQNNEDNKDELNDLFEIVYDNKIKYFELIKGLIIDYKDKGKEIFIKNSYYFINFSFLIYSDFKNNLTLSLNERIILEEINKEKKAILDSQDMQIRQIFLCNTFISLSKKILSLLKEVLNAELNFNKAKKLVDLSLLLKQLKSHEFKENIFSHKLENISNSKHLILICSIVFEEIYNTALNSSQIPIRDNIQPLEDIFHNNSNKINKLISLSLDLTNNNCFIMRAGKGLFSNINKNLFDLFPLIFKQYQINHFISKILENFEKEKKENNELREFSKSKFSTKIIKGGLKPINKNINKKEYIEIKLILCENISSKIYYKLITLKLTPLLNNKFLSFILFDGYFYLHKNTLITFKNFEDNGVIKEKLISVSEPELENSIDAYSIPFKKYISLQNSQGIIIQKIFSFNMEHKHFTVYILEKKEKEIKKSEKKLNQIKIEDEDEEFQTNVKRNTNIQLIEDNASVSSANTGSTFSGGLSNIGIRNKKTDSMFEYRRFNTIKTINFFVILIAFILLIIEYFTLNSSKMEVFNSSIMIFLYKELYKVYYRLFSSLLNSACIFSEGKCVKIIDAFINDYSSQNNSDTIDFENLFLIQNQIQAQTLMERKDYLTKIHSFIGNKNYNELFGRNIIYVKISQTIKNQKYFYNLTPINMPFSEAILSACNSFKTLTEKTNHPLILLSGKVDPFGYLNSLENNNLEDDQKELYELILNYRNYYEIFNSINDDLHSLIIPKYITLKVMTYIYVIIDLLILAFIGTLMYSYSLSFEFILIKIINYVNMTINIKSDEFNFSELFLKKIEYLESILEFYNSDPIKNVQNLNTLYNNYQQYLNSKNKNNSSEMYRKNYKKIEEEKKNKLEVPKNHRIMNRKDVRTLGITFKFTFLYYFCLITLFGIYTVLIILWNKFFSIEDNLFNLYSKNNLLENAIYRAINSYDLMIFHNLTLKDVSQIMLFKGQDEEVDDTELIKSFYESLKFSFNNKIEKSKVGDMLKDFDDYGVFTCDKLYDMSKEYIKIIEDKALEMEIDSLKNIQQKLIQMCEISRIAETQDFRTIYERHLHFIRNGILSMNDFTYNGIINYITKDKTFSKISLFFNVVMIYFLEINHSKPENESIIKYRERIKILIILTIIILLFYDLFAIFLFLFFYVSGINNLCSQIFILKKIFKIFELHE